MKRTEFSGEVPRFVALLDAVPSNGLLRIPIAITGKWVRGQTEFTITHDDLTEIVSNFAKRPNGEINVDYEHASEMPEVAAGGPVLSAGRIVKIDPPAARKGDGREVLWAWYEPTQRARDLIKNREYRYISPAIDWSAVDKQTGKPQGTTITSIALTNRPFLEELPEIRLSDRSFRLVGANTVTTAGEANAEKGGTVKTLKPRRVLGLFDGETFVGYMEEAEVRPFLPARLTDLPYDFITLGRKDALPKLTMKPNKPGERVVFDASGLAIGMIFLDDLKLDENEFKVLAAKHARDKEDKVKLLDYGTHYVVSALTMKKDQPGRRIIYSPSGFACGYIDLVELQLDQSEFSDLAMKFAWATGGAMPFQTALRELGKVMAENSSWSFSSALKLIASECPELANRARKEVM